MRHVHDMDDQGFCLKCDAFDPRPDPRVVRAHRDNTDGECIMLIRGHLARAGHEHAFADDAARLAADDLIALRERLAAAEALSESRRVTLLAKSDELVAEWKRAETAEALVREFVAVARAADQAYEDEHGGYDALASDSQEHVRELIAALSPAARERMKETP